jgi:hypothetical protein
MPVVGDAWPDIEGALRTYLRADPGLATLISSRVYFAIPPDSAGKFPCIKITRVGGGQDPSQAPLDLALIQFDVYGKTSNEEGGGRGPTTLVLNALRKALSTIQGATALDDKVMAWDADVRAVFFSSLPADDRPRFIVTVSVPARAIG